MLLLLSSLLLSSLFGACQSPTKQSPKAPAAKGEATLHLALTPTLDCFPLLYLAEASIADSLGLSLALHRYAAQIDADTAIASSYFEGGVTDRYRIAAGGRKTQRLQKVVDYPTPWSLLLVSKLRLPQLNRLKGRTVAIARNSACEATLTHLLDSLRLARSSVYQPQINSYALRLKMLNNEQLEAVVLPEPYATLAVQAGHKRCYSRCAASSDRALYLRPLSAKDEQRRAQRELLKRAYNIAVREVNARGAKVDSVLSRHFALTPEACAQLRLPRYSPMP